MKIKNVQFSVVILVSLVVLSFAFYVFAQDNSSTSNNIFLDSDQDGLSDQEEALYGTDPHNKDTDNDGYSDGIEIKSGYNPLKPAPGDKLPINSPGTSAQTSSNSDLTEKIAQQVSSLTQANLENQNDEINLDDIDKVLSDTLDQSDSEIILPEVPKDSLKIKKQNYSGLSENKQKEKKKEDLMDYTAAISYIFVSNSPQAISSDSDVSNTISSMTESLIKDITTRNTGNLENYSQSADKILEQLKSVEVPEEMVDTHIKAIQFVMYSQKMSGLIAPSSDSLADIANFSKIQGFLNSLISFTDEIQSKFDEYGITMDDALKQKVENYGV